MQTISNLWYVWLIGLILSLGYAFINQAQRIISAIRGDIDSVFKNLTGAPMVAFIVSGLIASGCGIMLIISIIIKLVVYFAR
jgi:hypothetical protein